MNAPSDGGFAAPPGRDRPPLAIVAEVGVELHRLFRAEEARGGRLQAILGRSRMRVSVVLPALLVLAGATAAVAAVALSGGRTAPVPLPAGGGVLCPVGYQYLTSKVSGLVYPPNYPGSLPRSARGAGCYGTQQEAIDAGYKLAPTPAGDVRLGQLYLAPASALVDRVCREARRLMRAAVYCPRLLPAPWTDPTEGMNYDCPTAGCSIPLLSLWGSFSAAPSYSGSNPGIGEVAIWEVSTRQQRSFPYLVGCPRSAGPLQRTVFRGHPATWYGCQLFGRSGSALTWRIGNERYGVSADGPPSQRRRLVRYIADHMARLAPRR